MKILFNAPRGTLDILPEKVEIWRTIKNIAIKTSEKFGFGEIVLPTFENKKLFTRSVGDETDIVQKEMFSFFDLGGRELALRPEGTASVARSIIENGLLNNALPLKLFYIINCFRNERPQAGRYKEFYQFGVELFGSKEPIAEFEVLALASAFFKELEIDDLNLEINSIGCPKCRGDFIEKLKQYYEEHKEKICKNCNIRLYKNTLRLLDCKEECCKEIKKSAPKILDFLCENCRTHFDSVCSFLNFNKIEYTINPNIVRGLDYYTKTVFEFTTAKLGSQATVCGGGRYDTLIETLGGPKTPSLGFAVGLNRLVLLLENKEKFQKKHKCDIYIGNLDEKSLLKVSNIAQNLKNKGIYVEINLLKRSVKAQMKYANKINATFSCIIGENELKSNSIILKNMINNSSFKLTLNHFEEDFSKILNSNKGVL